MNFDKLIWINQICFVSIFEKNILEIYFSQTIFLTIIQIIFKTLKLTGSLKSQSLHYLNFFILKNIIITSKNSFYMKKN